MIHWKTSTGPSGGETAIDREFNEVAIFDGTTRTLLDLNTDAEINWLIYDPTTEHLLYTSAAPSMGIFAVPFDLSSHRATGTPVLVAGGAASLSLAGDGSLLYMETASLGGENELVWADRAGRVTEVIASCEAGPGRP